MRSQLYKTDLMLNKEHKQQAATDFMVSYGIAILIVSIAVYVILRLGVFSNNLAQPTCASQPSFACGDAVLNSNGLLTFVVTQAIGGTINVTGVSCSSSINVTGNLPQYGNTKVQSNTIAPQYYPNSALRYGALIYSGSSAQITVWCYSSGGISSSNLGTPYTGYIWFNYTYTGLPSTYHTVQRVLQFTTRSA